MIYRILAKGVKNWTEVYFTEANSLAEALEKFGEQCPEMKVTSISEEDINLLK